MVYDSFTQIVVHELLPFLEKGALEETKLKGIKRFILPVIK